MKTKIVNFGLLLLISLISLSFLFLILEAYLRINNKLALNLKYREGFLDFFNKEPTINQYRLAKDLLVGWEHNPNNEHFKVNSLGFLDKEHKLQKGKNVYRIVIIGDSITELNNVGSKNYVHFLDELLNDSDLKQKFEIWNCGVAAYNIINYYGILREKILKFNPDLIIIGFSLNDFGSFTPVVFKDKKLDKWIGFDWNIQGYPVFYTFPVNTKLFVKSYVYRFVILLLQKIIKGNLGKNVDDFNIARWALGKIRGITIDKDIKLLGVIVPYFKSKYKKHEEDEYIRAKQLLGESRIRYLDLHGKFSEIDVLSWKKECDDYVHPSKKGHEVIARQIYNYLLKNLNWWYQPDKSK